MLISMQKQSFCGTTSDLIVITGPHSCGKTSLLFHHALSHCKAGSRVLYVCPQPINKTPLYHSAFDSHEEVPPPSVQEKLNFRYPSSIEGLQQLFDNLHLEGGPWHRERLSCIIIDDFHKYISGTLAKNRLHEVSANVARACAHVVDAIKCVSGTSSPPVQCVISTLEQTPPVFKMEVVQKWFPMVLQINKVSESNFSISFYGNSQDNLQSYKLHPTHIEFM